MENDVSENLSLVTCHSPLTLHRLYGLRFFNFLTAIFAGASRIVTPEFEHCLAEVVDNVFAVEVDVFHQRATVLAVEDSVPLFARPPPPLHHNSNRIRRTLRRVRYIGRNEEGL